MFELKIYLNIISKKIALKIVFKYKDHFILQSYVYINLFIKFFCMICIFVYLLTYIFFEFEYFNIYFKVFFQTSSPKFKYFIVFSTVSPFPSAYCSSHFV